MNVYLMEGLGNTFTVMKGPYSVSTELVVEQCQKNKTDGFLLVTPQDNTNVLMEYWNADGSRAEMCGNGIRCVARFAIDHKMINTNTFAILTDAGKLKVNWDGSDPSIIDAQVGKAVLVAKEITLRGLKFTTVDVGNPHAITIVQDVTKAPVTTVGPVIEADPYFPFRTNVEFVEIVSENEINMRVWERGVGETKACGTGMAASAFVSSLLNNYHGKIRVNVPGGSADVWIDEERYSRIKGPANYQM